MKIAYNLARGILLLFALLFIVLGLQWLFVPQNLTDQFSVIPNGILGWATFRADFGAFFLVTGMTAAVGASNRASANHYLICSAALLGCAALGRIVGFVLDGIPEGGIPPFIVELIALATITATASLRQRLAAQAST